MSILTLLAVLSAAIAASLIAVGFFFQARRAAIPAAAKPPSDWRRVITGIMGAPLVGLGLLLVAAGATYLPRALSGDDECRFLAAEDSCSSFALFFGVLGVGIALFGVPFAIATLVPFGTFRRVMVGVGVAAIGGLVFAVALSLILSLPDANGSSPDVIVLPWAAVVALPAAVGFYYLGYRIAR